MIAQTICLLINCAMILPVGWCAVTSRTNASTERKNLCRTKSRLLLRSFLSLIAHEELLRVIAIYHSRENIHVLWRKGMY